MTTFQKVIKYLAMAFAIILSVSIFSGIVSAIGLFNGLFAGNGVAEEMKIYSDFSEIRNMDIQINAADVSIKEGKSFAYQSENFHLVFLYFFYKIFSITYRFFAADSCQFFLTTCSVVICPCKL